MHASVRAPRAESAGSAVDGTEQKQPERQNLSLGKLEEQAKLSVKKIDLEKFEYSVENVRCAWENLKELVRNRIPAMYNAISSQSVNVVEAHHAVVVFSNEGALNTFDAFKERAENYFKQVFSLDEFTVEGTVDRSVLASVDPSTLSTPDFCVYLQEKYETVGRLFDEFSLKTQ